MTEPNRPAPSTLADVVGCLSAYDPNALPVADAQAVIRRFVAPLDAVEKVTLRSALGRVLAANVMSPIDVPAHDNSAMDGFALRSADLLVDGPTTLKVVGTAYAGRAFDGEMAAGEALRVMTGAVMPAGCDTVVPQEFTRDASDAAVTIPPGVVRAGDNRR
ncbi:MAG: molybdopterin molybdenumtransferase MoeA, partial [Burkholderiaceae bacterium]